jgi:preprotein translocase subunit SecA
VGQALRAHKLFTTDVDYIVKDGKVVIIDEFTGRMQEGRRYSEGLHQALEAKENVPVQNENQTLASITYQNYFRMYKKLAGMTGTAMTEAQEFGDIYGLQVVEIPTHMQVARKDEDDVVYRTGEEKFDAIVDAIADANKRKQPVLVGTVSIEKSELVSKLLKKKGIKHNVLNAKFHEQEAGIIAQAGRPGAVTIATNMAGRGTDIKLGGNPEMDKSKDAAKWDVEKEKKIVLEAGGLFVLGTERHESRRIDNQLRGRSGRQGDPGLSRFYLSLEDDLMKIFGSERMDKMLGLLGMQKGEAITHRYVSKALETAQKKVEARNYDIRKNLLKFDNVMNDQRKVIYGQRVDIMASTDVSETIKQFRDTAIEDMVYGAIPQSAMPDEWDVKGLDLGLQRMFGINFNIQKMADEEGVSENEILERVRAEVEAFTALRERKFSSPVMRDMEKQVLLVTLDQMWKEHLHNLDNIRQGIYLRAYGQKDPLNEYKHEAFRLFEGMLGALASVVTERMAHIEIQKTDVLEQKQRELKTRESHAFPDEVEESNQPARRFVAPEERVASDTSTWGKVGRNEPCPCGSGKKYKACHGSLV